MLETVREIGQSIRESYKWINEKKIIYLVIDNAGGHGTTEAKKEYMKILMNEFCIQVIWQIANSPDSNMLDLGAWMSIQSQVESIHRQLVMQNDVLAGSVEEAFENLSEQMLHNIYERWVLVLDLMIRDEGGNKLVEKCRRKDDKVEDFVHINEDMHKGIIIVEDSTDEEFENVDEDNDYT